MPPAPPEFIAGRLAIFEQWMNAPSAAELTASQQGALALARVVEVKPFEDGNGRVSRLAASHLMVKAGARPPILDPADASRLEKALQAAFQLHTEPLAALLEEAAERALDLLIREAERRPDDPHSAATSGMRRTRMVGPCSRPGMGANSARPGTGRKASDSCGSGCAGVEAAEGHRGDDHVLHAFVAVALHAAGDQPGLLGDLVARAVEHGGVALEREVGAGRERALDPFPRLVAGIAPCGLDVVEACRVQGRGEKGDAGPPRPAGSEGSSARGRRRGPIAAARRKRRRRGWPGRVDREQVRAGS